MIGGGFRLLVSFVGALLASSKNLAVTLSSFVFLLSAWSLLEVLDHGSLSPDEYPLSIVFPSPTTPHPPCSAPGYRLLGTGGARLVAAATATHGDGRSRGGGGLTATGWIVFGTFPLLCGVRALVGVPRAIVG